MNEARTLLENGDVARRLRSAFPQGVTAQVDAALAIIAMGQHAPTAHDIGSIVVGSEKLHIPARLYYPEPEPAQVARLSEASRHILACLFTRHHDGFVREKHVRQLLTFRSTPWEPPYLLQLIGEYVAEIVDVVLKEVHRLRNEHFAGFVLENKNFIRTIRHRVISYWDRYYRSQYSRLADYPGFQLMAALELWGEHDARRQLAR